MAAEGHFPSAASLNLTFLWSLVQRELVNGLAPDQPHFPKPTNPE